VLFWGLVIAPVSSCYCCLEGQGATNMLLCALLGCFAIVVRWGWCLCGFVVSVQWASVGGLGVFLVVVLNVCSVLGSSRLGAAWGCAPGGAIGMYSVGVDACLFGSGGAYRVVLIFVGLARLLLWQPAGFTCEVHRSPR